MKKCLCLLVPALFLLAACTSSTSPQSDRGQVSAKQGKLSMFLTDAPLEADKILVDYSEIAVHKTGGGFETIWTGTKTMDLVELRDREELLLDAPLEAGFYTQIRFVIASGDIVVEGKTYPLEVPSSEIKFQANFEVKEGGTTKLVLDFDAEKSIHVIGAGKKKTDNATYILRPVILVKSVTF